MSASDEQNDLTHQIPLRVAIWKFSPTEFVVVKVWRGPSWQRVGDIHPTEARAREAARFIPRKRPLIGLNDLSAMDKRAKA